MWTVCQMYMTTVVEVVKRFDMLCSVEALHQPEAAAGGLLKLGSQPA